MPDPFSLVKSQVDRSLVQFISCSWCVDNDYTKGKIMIIITKMALMVRSANDQLGGNNRKAVHQKNTEKCEVVTCSCPRSR